MSRPPLRGVSPAGVLEAPAPVDADRLRILFVGGYGRSGSTVLDVLLDNAGPHIFGGGELRTLFEELRSGGRCSCGVPYARCEFWSEVLDEPFEDPGTSPGGWRAFYERLRRVSGARVIVDSSKTTIRTYHHLPRLKRCGFDVRVVHLVRDPRAVMWSVHRGSNEALEAGRNPGLRGGMGRGLVGWTLSNLVLERICRRLGVPVMRLRYEDLVRAPIEHMVRIGEFAGVDTGPVVRKLATDEGLSGGHGVGGNRMRRRGPIHIRSDSEWRDRLPLHGRMLGVLGWPLAHRYGYRLAEDRGGI